MIKGSSRIGGLFGIGLCGVMLAAAGPAGADTGAISSGSGGLQALAARPPILRAASNRIKNDPSGQRERGAASYYGPEFAGRRMADGQRFDPHSNAAASKTLPLGTTARVTNLKNGKSAVITVHDRGPFIADRLVDLSPKTAAELDFTQQGVTPVIIAPISVPQPDGSTKPGAGAVVTPR